ncbi:MAG: hypothetical protein EBX39_08720 [Actinobacteria bacterium]|nr:hypothetical protein [Actinomycetota bacterium]
MPRTLAEILEHADSLAARFETQEFEMRDAVHLRNLIAAVENRASAEASIDAAVRAAREDGIPWGLIGSVLGTSGEAARQRYGKPAA